MAKYDHNINLGQQTYAEEPKRALHGLWSRDAVTSTRRLGHVSRCEDDLCHASMFDTVQRQTVSYRTTCGCGGMWCAHRQDEGITPIGDAAAAQPSICD